MFATNKLPYSYWNLQSNRKKFLDTIAIQFNIQKPSDWGNITIHQIYKSGGRTLLKNHFKNSLINCLQSVYKDIEWKREWFSNLPQVPISHWKSMENRKQLLDKIAIELNIKKPSDWGKVNIKRIYELGGTTLLKKYYKCSLFSCLQSVYKDIDWKRQWFANPTYKGKLYWRSIENHKNFLDEIAKKLEIKTPSDWGKVTIHRFHKLGGSFLKKHYRNSLYICLKSVYKDIEWKKEWFSNISQSFWKPMANRKEFLDKIAKELQIKNPSDWGTVTLRRLYELGGGTLLSRYYKNSMRVCLQSVYSDIEWKREWFSNISFYPSSYWKSMDNRKKCMDRIAIELCIKKPSDWGKITFQHVCELGGGTLLSYYKNSLFACLQSIYKDIEWKREWFSNINRFPKKYWDSIENCKKFMDEIASSSNIYLINDWKKITIAFIIKQGGRGLLQKYGSSVHSTLKAVYPFAAWDSLVFSKTSTEMHLQGLITRVFPHENTFSKHRNHQIQSF